MRSNVACGEEDDIVDRDKIPINRGALHLDASRPPDSVPLDTVPLDMSLPDTALLVLS